MTIQHAKFLKIAAEVSWRPSLPSLNYIETSTLWRQEHNGFSHQDPMFINNLVNLKSNIVRIYLPPDANCFLVSLHHCLTSYNKVNLLIGTKADMPVYLSMEEAEKHCVAGVGVWKWASTYNAEKPDVVLVGCGNETTFEVIKAARLLERDCPRLRVRVVNVTDLMTLEKYGGHPHALTTAEFNGIFTPNKPVIVNFHGYPSVIKQLLFKRGNTSRFEVLGYIEEGTTTTPFKMLTANQVSRFDVAICAILRVLEQNPEYGVDMAGLVALYKNKIRGHDVYIRKFGKDPVDIDNLDDTIPSDKNV